jgi:hypothetical protein
MARLILRLKNIEIEKLRFRELRLKTEIEKLRLKLIPTSMIDLGQRLILEVDSK